MNTTYTNITDTDITDNIYINSNNNDNNNDSTNLLNVKYKNNLTNLMFSKAGPISSGPSYGPFSIHVLYGRGEITHQFLRACSRD